jgi:hypothetical protein
MFAAYASTSTPKQWWDNEKTSLVRAVRAWPHDDTNSLIAFYGKPRETPSLLVEVPVPFAIDVHRG